MFQDIYRLTGKHKPRNFVLTQSRKPESFKRQLNEKTQPSPELRHKKPPRGLNQVPTCIFRRKSRYPDSRCSHKNFRRLKLKVGNTWVTRSKLIKYLGIQLNEFQKFNPHLKLAISKARGALSQIYSLLRNKVGLSTKIKQILYKTLVYVTELQRRSLAEWKPGKSL